MNASEIVIDCLKKEGVQTVAGVSGRPILALLQAMEEGGIKGYQTRHEQGAGFLADGYARVRNRPGVVLVQRGPGVTNCVTPIANARIDGIPLIVLIGQGEMELFDKGALQELDHLAFLSYFAKWAFRLQEVKRIPEVIRRAFTIACSGKPGPVVLELPMNLLESPVHGPVEAYLPVGRAHRPAGDPQKIDLAVRALLEVRSPVIYAGAGVLRSEASPELLELAELLALPVMTSLPGKSCFPEDHPLSLGLGGFPRATYGTRQAHQAVARADWVLALGCSFREHGTRCFQARPPGTRLIQVDISELELGKNYAADIGILADIKSALRQMLDAALPLVENRQLREQVAQRRKRVTEEIRKTRAEWLGEWQEHLHSSAVPIDPYRITAEIAGAVDLERSIILHDAGLVRAYICHHLVTRRPGSFVGFGGFSAMGYSIPAAIGAKIAAPDKEVIAIVGDGSFGMTGFEVETAVRYGVKTVALVYNNGGMDAVRMLQQRRGERYVWDELGGRYAEIARALGAFSLKIERPEEIKPALQEALAQEKPAVLELMVQALVPTPDYP